MPQIVQSAPLLTDANAGAGLSTAEARKRFAQGGSNEPVSASRRSGLIQILFLFLNPLAIILLVASAVSAAAGQVINAAIIALMVLLSAALNFIQTYRSQRAVDRIRKEVAPVAAVLRDGEALARRQSMSGIRDRQEHWLVRKA